MSRRARSLSEQSLRRIGLSAPLSGFVERAADTADIRLEKVSVLWHCNAMNGPPIPSEDRYDSVAPRWGDKMRTLGYYDAYLGFITDGEEPAHRRVRVIDIGAGTAAFSEAWIASRGRPASITLLDPSRGMLERSDFALRRRGVEPLLVQGLLGAVDVEVFDVALASHVIEHCDDPKAALREISELLSPGGLLYLVFSKPHWCNAIIWLQWRHRTFQKEHMLELLTEVGFEVERTYAFPAGPPSRTSMGIVAVKSS
ncbi:class I SAM-dependent methyltransferase [Roseibacterium sp. SDUM158017]|uniref:class I SAM-dependent methyltransferase n=1 Tax=Roseicyclus salinarum TaxID=3036773 RepID=UPI002414EC3D|nr:class I SAM-dependent methyltransferase [Roseibacterium sp. SDUM158017]MDG4648721.1 class I SAM-dependent methyltransferase [Roseibacterium sp. SDUM158017]